MKEATEYCNYKKNYEKHNEKRKQLDSFLKSKNVKIKLQVKKTANLQGSDLSDRLCERKVGWTIIDIFSQLLVFKGSSSRRF